MKPRIITGSAKGQKLKVPKKGTRPMTDRVKSALFSIINELVADSKVLDLFAGTGALGIECLSRGAKHATFVDKSHEAVDCIGKNLEKTGFTSLGKIVHSRAEEFIKQNPTNSFDIVFICPPHKNFNESILGNASSLLTKKGIIVAEFPSLITTSDKIKNLEKIDSRKYGITSLSFYLNSNK